MPTVRDTIDPLRERDVSEQEATDLERMGILLAGTRAKTPEGLRAAATRQSVQREADAFAAETAARPISRPVTPTDAEDQDDDAGPGDQHDQTPGDAPVSTTDDTPDSPQES